MGYVKSSPSETHFLLVLPFPKKHNTKCNKDTFITFEMHKSNAKREEVNRKCLARMNKTLQMLFQRTQIDALKDGKILSTW